MFSPPQPCKLFCRISRTCWSALVGLLCGVKSDKKKKRRKENQGGKVRKSFDEGENIVFVLEYWKMVIDVINSRVKRFNTNTSKIKMKMEKNNEVYMRKLLNIKTWQRNEKVEWINSMTHADIHTHTHTHTHTHKLLLPHTHYGD